MNVTLSPSDFATLKKIQSRHQILVYLMLLSICLDDGDLSSYSSNELIDKIIEEMNYSRGKTIDVLNSLLNDRFIELENEHLGLETSKIILPRKTT